MGLSTPAKVRKLQEALHAKAKGSPEYRFYTLYDKVYRADVLWLRTAAARSMAARQAWTARRSRTSRNTADEVVGRTGGRAQDEDVSSQSGAAGLHPQTGTASRDRWVFRRLRTAWCMTAAVLVLEPIFEADLQPEQHAYRPGRSALDAVHQVHSLLKHGQTEVIDADLSGYFDSIPHAELMKSVSRRISDRHMLRLIKMWLEAPVEEIDDRGRRHRTTRNKDERRGCPQGAPISPLLSNLYMRRFILGWKTLGHQQRLRAKIVNYADDFVICCRGTAEEAMHVMRSMMRSAEVDGERNQDAGLSRAGRIV